MSRRRPSAEGTIFQLPDGRWAAVIDLPRHPNGRRNRRKREAPTKSQAQELLREMRREIDRFGSLPPADRRISQTLAEYVDQVLLPARAGKGLSPDHRAIHEAIDTHLGNRRSAQLSVQECDAFLAAFASGEANVSGRPVGRDYVRRTRSFLRNAINNDMRLGYLNRNVADLAVMPEVSTTARPRRALTVEEWRRLYASASGALKVAIDLSGRHGLRPQETRSLRWTALDLDRGTLSVVTQFDSSDDFVDPKTIDSTRTIELHQEAMELLTRWSSEQAATRQRVGTRWTDRDLVITTRWGTAINKDNYKRSIVSACRHADVDPITPYELRHTAITHQVEAVGSAAPVADWAGTSELMIWRHYRHKLVDVVRLAPPSYSL